MSADSRCSMVKIRRERGTKKLLTDEVMSRVFIMQPGYNAETNRVEFNLNETWLTAVYDHNKLERRRAFEHYRCEMTRAAVAKGYRVFLRPESDAENSEGPVFGTLTQAEINTIRVAEFDRTPWITPEQAAAIEAKKATVTASAAEKMALKKHNYLQHFDCEAVDGWHYVAVEPKLQQVFNAALTLRQSPLQAHERDKANLAGQYASLVCASAPCLQLINELSQLLGLNGPLDTTTRVSSDHINAIKHRIWQKRVELDALFKLRTSSKPDAHGQYSLSQTVRLISSVYRSWCHVALKRVSQSRRRQRAPRSFHYTLQPCSLSAGGGGVDNHEFDILQVAQQSSFFSSYRDGHNCV